MQNNSIVLYTNNGKKQKRQQSQQTKMNFNRTKQTIQDCTLTLNKQIIVYVQDLFYCPPISNKDFSHIFSQTKHLHNILNEQEN